MRKFFIFLVTGCWFLVSLAGCQPTYPKGQFKESIVKLCKKEYKLDVKVDTTGKTIAIYLPLDNLIDFNFAITKAAGEKINDVILSVSRAALSTDAQYDFYCIIAHDTRIPEIQIVIVKSVDDVKRFLLNDISRDDYSKRMLIDIRLSPQAQKERSIKEVLDKMSVDKKTQEQVMGDFFRSEPAALGDIGYWNDHFYIKDISLSEFIAEQIANRIKVSYRERPELADTFFLKSVKGAYASQDKKAFFKIEVTADSRIMEGVVDEDNSKKIFGSALDIAAGTIHGYRFGDFDYIEITDQTRGRTVTVSKEKLEAFRRKKVKIGELIK